MDLNKYDSKAAATKGAFLHLEYEGKKLMTEEGEPIGMTMLGSDSPEYQQHMYKQSDARIAKASVTRRGRIKNVKTEATAQDGIELNARVTTELHHIVVEDVEIECTFENVVKLLNRFPWISEQADDFVNERSNFLGE